MFLSFLSYKKRYFFLSLIISLITLLLLPAICLADADIIFKENSKAVVVIYAYDKEGNPTSQGSGFIVRNDGAVVTNYHVISNAEDIKVKAGDKVLKVSGLLHTDIENDIVILKVESKGLPVVKIGDIDKAEVGEDIFVISSPQGLENTISNGILSGIREIEPKRKILQITAPISAGSSGGAVFNRNGQVIGIATFLIREAQNVNFAMPINLIKDKITSKKIIALKEAPIVDYVETAEYWFILGYYLSADGLYKEAINAYKQAIRIKPNDADAYYNLGINYIELGLYKEAVDAYKQTIRIKPNDADAYYNLGVTYGKLGMYKEAIEACKQTVRIKPDFAMAHNSLGFAYSRIGMYKEAMESHKQAIRIKPDYADAYYNLGVAYGKLDMYKEAISAYKQTIRIKPDYADAYLNLGFAYEMLGMYKEAINACKQAIRIKPDYAKAHFALGLGYILINDRGSALEEYKILKDLDSELANELFNMIYK